MKVQNSTIDSEYKLTTYDNGVQYIVYNSTSWLVGCDHDKTGDSLKAKFFPEPKNILENEIKKFLQRERCVSTLGRGTQYDVKLLAYKLNVSTRKIFAIFRKAEWCNAEQRFTETIHGDEKVYYNYRYAG